MLQPATPVNAETKKLSATATAGSVTLGIDTNQIIVTVKSSTDTVFMRIGSDATTAVTAVVDTDCPIPDGQYSFTKPDAARIISFICAGTGTATVWVTPSFGN